MQHTQPMNNFSTSPPPYLQFKTSHRSAIGFFNCCWKTKSRKIFDKTQIDSGGFICIIRLRCSLFSSLHFTWFSFLCIIFVFDHWLKHQSAVSILASLFHVIFKVWNRQQMKFETFSSLQPTKNTGKTNIFLIILHEFAFWFRSSRNKHWN